MREGNVFTRQVSGRGGLHCVKQKSMSSKREDVHEKLHTNQYKFKFTAFCITEMLRAYSVETVTYMV